MARSKTGLLTRVTNFLKGNNSLQNAFNRAFHALLGAGFTRYDAKGPTYVKEGFNTNPIVYSVVQQMATKTAAVPYEVKRVKNKRSAKQYFLNYKNVTPENMTAFVKKLKTNAAGYEEEVLEMPFETPNPLQTWDEFFALYKVFIRLTGNAYIYMLRPEMGKDAGKPIGVYMLPAHLIQIVMKGNAALLQELENPVEEYMLIEGETYARFDAEDIIHIKLPNPNFDTQGSHLYGQSPLRAALTTMASSNEAMKNNVKMMQSGGAFGIIHGKKEPLNETTAAQIKERLKEMDLDRSRLANFAGVSTEIGFTQLNLSTKDLMPFDYLEFDQKQICNVLGWSDKLLNNDAGAKYDNVNHFRKQVITDNIMPDLDLIATALNRAFFTLFKEYEGAEIHFDATQLPEMQQDTEKMVGWLLQLVGNGVITRQEARQALLYTELDNPEMDVLTVAMSVMPLSEAVMKIEEQPANPPGKDPKDDEDDTDGEGDDEGKRFGGSYTEKFDPNQPRDSRGRWTDGGAGNKITVYRGVGRNYAEGENEGYLWVATNKETAANYADWDENGDPIIEEIEINMPQNLFKIPYKNQNQYVTSDNVGNLFRRELSKLVKAKEVTIEEYREISDKIRTYVQRAGDNVERIHTKFNKPAVARLSADILLDLRFDAIEIDEGDGPTYGLILPKKDSKKFDPNQPRDRRGRWTDSNGEKWYKLETKVQAKVHNNLPKSERGSSFSLDGKDLIGQDLYAVGVFTEASDTIDGAVITAKDIDDFIQENSAKFQADKSLAVGTWYDAEENKVWFDISRTYSNRNEAIAAGIRHNQKAIFHLKTKTPIDTGGTGKVKAKKGSAEYREIVSARGKWLKEIVHKGKVPKSRKS